jgi:hypothetical protein
VRFKDSLSVLNNKMCFREATGAQVNGFPNAVQRGFKSYNEARSAWLHSRANHTVGPPEPHVPLASAAVHCSLTPPATLPLASIHTVVPSPRNLTPPPTSPVTSSTTYPPPKCPSTLLGSLNSCAIPVASPLPQRNSDLPSTLDVSQAFPSVSTPPPRHGNLTLRHPAPHPMSISDEDAFWVVTRGERPGVYHGKYVIYSIRLNELIDIRAAASAALGLRGHRHVIKVGSRDQADRAFTNQYMRGDIDEIVDLIALNTLEAEAAASGQ